MRREKDFLPCSCKLCYFCKNKHTNGIYHDNTRMVYHPPPNAPKNSRRQMIKPKCLDTPYMIEEKPMYCKMCYANHSEQIKKLVHRNKRKSKKYSNQSKLGCAWCRETICNICWPKYIANGHRKEMDE